MSRIFPLNKTKPELSTLKEKLTKYITKGQEGYDRDLLINLSTLYLSVYPGIPFTILDTTITKAIKDNSLTGLFNSTLKFNLVMYKSIGSNGYVNTIPSSLDTSVCVTLLACETCKLEIDYKRVFGVEPEPNSWNDTKRKISMRALVKYEDEILNNLSAYNIQVDLKEFIKTVKSKEELRKSIIRHIIDNDLTLPKYVKPFTL